MREARLTLLFVGVPGKYRTGRKRVVTDYFKSEVIRRLAERGKPHAWLEEQLNLGTGALHQLLKRNKTSIYVDSICEILDIKLPDEESPEISELIILFESLGESGRAAALAMLRGLTSTTEKK